MRILFSILMLFIAQSLIAQILQNEETKVSPEQIVDFKYTDCERVSETTMQVDEFPHLLQLSEPIKQLKNKSQRLVTQYSIELISRGCNVTVYLPIGSFWSSPSYRLDLILY